MNKKGQSIFQYTVLIVAVVLGLLTISVYFRLILQGHWKQNTDAFSADFYGPATETNRVVEDLGDATNRVTQNSEDTISGNRFSLQTEYRVPEPLIEGANITTIN